MTGYSDSPSEKRNESTCGRCQSPAKGHASINGQRYCHEGESPTCYELASRPTGAADCWLCDPVAPSSPEAVARGCTCPDTTNGLDHRGIEWTDDRTVWAVASDCPIHARALPHAPPAAELYEPETR